MKYQIGRHQRHRNLFFKIPILVTLVILIANGLWFRWHYQGDDASGYADLFSAKLSERSLSNIGFSYGNSFYSLTHFLSKSANSFCPDGIPNIYEGKNFFFWHPYLVSIPTRFLANLFPNPIYLTLVLEALSYVFGLYFVYSYVQNSFSNKWKAAAPSILILLSPLVYESILGMPEVDRLFFGLGIWLVLNLFDVNKNKSWSVILVSLISITLSERATSAVAILMLTSILYEVVNKQIKDKFTLFKFTICLISVFWFIYWKGISLNPDYKSINFSLLFYNFKSIFFGERTNLGLIFLVGVLPYLIHSLKKPIYVLTAMLVILPNVLISVGGAELTGYHTHYHSIYTPIIIGIWVITTFDSLIPRQIIYRRLVISSVLILISGFIQISSNQLSAFNEIAPKYAKKMMAVFNGYSASEEESLRKVWTSKIQIAKLIGETKSYEISAPSELMTSLVYSNQPRISYFPVGIGTDKFVISQINLDSNRPVVNIDGRVKDSESLSECLAINLKKKYVVIKDFEINGQTYRLFRKIESMSTGS